jgi:tRNA pseudouridine38-40 synthase
MRSLKLTIAYDGTNYVGWQRQASGVSIQQLVERAFEPIAGGAPAVAGAGRTDAGVHALGQVASVKIDTALPAATLRRALNFRLPPDVRVLRVEDAPLDFHARFEATGKRYRYRLATASVLSPFERWFVWHAPGRRDVDAMRRAAAVLVGCHDFASFQPADPDAEDTVRTIRELTIREDQAELVFDIEGDGFLRHMVRSIVGTLAEIGAGRRAPESMPDVLAARDRQAAGRTAPARGLTLMEVTYQRVKE